MSFERAVSRHFDAESKVGESPQHHRAELRLWLRLLTCVNLIEAEIRKRLREQFGTTLPRFDLMAQLERAADGVLLGELSKRMMVSNGNVTGLIERLVQEGLIERQVSARDRRSARVRLSGHGRKVFADMALAHNDWVSELLEGLPPRIRPNSGRGSAISSSRSMTRPAPSWTTRRPGASWSKTGELPIHLRGRGAIYRSGPQPNRTRRRAAPHQRGSVMAFETIWTGGEAIGDYDAAYANGAAIPGSEAYAPRWAADAAAFRATLIDAGRAELGVHYGREPRAFYDLFLPEAAPAGLLVYVHGGYWKAQEIGNWSHFAAGALQKGFAVALPEYTLCPDATIPAITRQIGAFLDQVARRIDGPIRLSGHSAGGHLVSRMLCEHAPIASATAARIDRTVSISGVHDLRSIMRTQMNAVLGLDGETARRESPALLRPRDGVDLVCLVGGAELPEFRRQNALLANAWHGLGARTRAIESPGRHHFDVVDDLRDPESELVAILTDGPSG